MATNRKGQNRNGHELKCYGFRSFRFLDVPGCGRFSMWPFPFVLFSVCGRFGLCLFRLSPSWEVAVYNILEIRMLL